MRGGRRQRHHYFLIWITPLLVLAAACSGVPPSSEDDHFAKAALSVQLGNLKQAQAEIEARAPAWRDHPESIWHWNYRMLSAEALAVQGRPQDALKLIDVALPDGPEFSALEARWKTARAGIFLRNRRTKEAGALLDEAQVLASRTGELSLLPKIENMRGQMLMQSNSAEAAEREFRAALSHAEEHHDLYYQAAALNNLGYIRLRSFRYDEAIPYLERALVTAGRAGATMIESAANTNLAICASRLGDFDKALASLHRAVEIEERQGADSLLQASLGEIANTYVRSDQADKAIPYYRRALDLARLLSAESDASRWSGNLAAALIEARDWNQAEVFNNASIALKEQLRDTASQNYSRLNAAEIAAGRQQFEVAGNLYEQTIRAATGNAAVLWEAHAGLGKLYTLTGNKRKASENFESAIRMIEDARGDLSAANFRISFLSRLIEFYQIYVDALVEQQDYDKALQIVESSRARVLWERLGRKGMPAASSRTSDYQAVAARSGAVLLSYWLAPERSFVWVVTPRTTQFFVLPPQPEIDSAILSHQTFIQNLRDPIDAEQIAGDRLFQMLLEPARHLIPQGSKVIIVPDGSLHSLNFETLPVAGALRHYWIEDVTVSVAPSLASPFGTKSLHRPRSVLLIGDPESTDPEFQALPFAGQEIRQVQGRLVSLEKTVYEGARAQPDTYRASRPESFSIIHFAAHASANRASPLDSAIVLSRGSGSSKLYARDIMDLPLNADLVTISSCRSAGARVYSGEGLVGFTWVFLQAGARNVIAGLWDVSDESTTMLMDSLYRGIAEGRQPPDALRLAKLDLIRSNGTFRKPFYWGPFQTYVGGSR
jgi:CHAT domain-containing protein/Tfp pilus assembly protein PilF